MKLAQIMLATALLTTPALAQHDMSTMAPTDAPMAGHDMSGMAGMAPAGEVDRSGTVITLGDLELIAPFSRATPPRAPTGGAYLSIVNNGTEDDRLLSGTTTVSEAVQLHEMSMENDIMRMREMKDGIPIPAGETLTLEPSGTHIMLVRLLAPLVEGETVPLTLTFEKAGTIELEVPIASIAARQAP